MKSKEARARCRQRWGASWYKCHPLIKKARLAWGQSPSGTQWDEKVRVYDVDGVYTV
mgnify:CR=1 FL=1